MNCSISTTKRNTNTTLQPKLDELKGLMPKEWRFNANTKAESGIYEIIITQVFRPFPTAKTYTQKTVNTALYTI